MNVLFEKKFLKDILAVSDKKIKTSVEQVIISLEKAGSLHEISNLKKLKGEKNAYRIRVGDYRIGLYVYEKHIVLARLLNRKEIYRYFPK
jgi:mRNA interferase RelE/StbE